MENKDRKSNMKGKNDMKTYVALITGVGEGCDYTIGCNLKWEIKRAENEDEVVREILDDYGMLDFEDESPESQIEKIKIFEVQGEGVEIDNIDVWYEQKCKKNTKKRREEEEREEYERLKAKFEK